MFKELKLAHGFTFEFTNFLKSKLIFDRGYFSEELRFKGKITDNQHNIEIKDTIFKDLVIFDIGIVPFICIRESLFQKGGFFTIDEQLPITRYHSSVWCYLKNQANSRNDQINALEYRRKELISFKAELKKSNGNKKERFVLWINEISNEHGLNWLRSVWFTLISWVISYCLFSAFRCNLSGTFVLFEKSYWKEAISFLWLPQGISELTEGLNRNQHWINSLFMVMFFLLGKILVAYGIFQTISAFRKHGKN
jgi:hypothetical protein